MGTYCVRFLVLLSVLIVARAVFAAAVDGGRGTLFGDDHAFAVTAPAGWVLDNESGVAQGLDMTFYPQGFTWENSPVIVYGNVSHWSSTSTSTSAQQQVDKTVAEFWKVFIIPAPAPRWFGASTLRFPPPRHPVPPPPASGRCAGLAASGIRPRGRARGGARRG